MYTSFYGLKEKPFNLLPDPDYLYMSQGHENAYTHLEYAIVESKGFVVITGEIGSGKTTLINFLLGKIQQDIQVGLINNTYVPPNQFIKMICQEFELDFENMDKAEMLELFQDFLLKQFAESKRVALIIDEAQNLTPKVMEEIRMLSNLEAEKQHLIQMVLVGQPDLKNKLQRKDLAQFAQRVTVHCHLNGLKEEEVGQYIRYRLKVGGAENLDIFDSGAIEIVSKYSRGIPRLINILCDTALVFGYADSLKAIDRKAIEEVIKAREAGGIFSEAPKDEQSDQLLVPSESAISQPFENRLQLLERRIHLLENTIDSVAQRLDGLTIKKAERDTVVLELFKMLKTSMDSRWNTLLSFSELKRKMDTAKRQGRANETGEEISPFFRLNVKKEKQ